MKQLILKDNKLRLVEVNGRCAMLLFLFVVYFVFFVLFYCSCVLVTFVFFVSLCIKNIFVDFRV